MERKCENCEWWVCTEIADEGTDEEYPLWGQCRRFPPPVAWKKNGDRYYSEDCCLEICYNWWCGEFKQKKVVVIGHIDMCCSVGICPLKW